MTHPALMADHPGWTTAPDGARVRLLATDSGLWLAASTSHDGLSVTNLVGGDEVKTIAQVTEADELPAHLPAALAAPLAGLGPVVRVPTPWLWEAISTAILRQVVRAAQARKVYRAWCSTHGTVVDTPYGPLATVPGPEKVLALAEQDFRAVGAAFHRSALRAAASAYLEHVDRWRGLPAVSLAVALTTVPRIGPWTASAASVDHHGDFAVYPHHDLAVRTWAARIAPAHSWPATDKAFGSAWRRLADDDRQLHALTLYTLTWGNIHADHRTPGGARP